MLEDLTTTALHSALDGLSQRQRTTADNISNIETPGFLAGRVTFEDSLRAALADGDDPAGVIPTVARSLEPTREDGNNVNLDHEVIANVDTNLRFELMLRAYDDRFGLLRTAIRG